MKDAFARLLMLKDIENRARVLRVAGIRHFIDADGDETTLWRELRPAWKFWAGPRWAIEMSTRDVPEKEDWRDIAKYTQRPPWDAQVTRL